MTLATHAVVGAAAASLTPGRPILGFFLGFASHFLIDAIPHWHYPLPSVTKDENNQLNNDVLVSDKNFPLDLLKMGADNLLGIMLALVFFQARYPYIFSAAFIGAIAGVFPDALQFVYTKWRHEPMVSLQRFHLWAHAKRDLNDQTARGLSYQILIMIVSVAIANGSLFFSLKNYFENFSSWSNPELAALVQEARHVEEAYQNEPEAPYATNALKVPIFIYHSVRPHIPAESKWQDAFDITPQLLEEELLYLRGHGYTPITLDDLASDFESGTTSPIAKPVLLTFDDGWENQYKYAFPLLKKYHVPAAFYVFTNPIGKKPHFFTWDQIKEMDAAGMTIASHTLTHPYLQHLSEEKLKKEIFESKQTLEEHLGHLVAHFASPFGFSNSYIEALLRDAGYKTGRTTYRGVYQDDPRFLRGILVSDSFDDFVKALK